MIQNRHIADLQTWLNNNTGSNLKIDGIGGNLTRQAILQGFSNKNAIAITESDLQEISKNLGDETTKRIKAVASVESRGSGWDSTGLPIILYERHLFFRFTTRENRKNISSFCNPNSGGYTLDANKNNINDSWEKLALAACVDPLAAFQSISIGKFQVLGRWYKQCGYMTPMDMLLAASKSELAHYKMLEQYILKVSYIKSEFLRLSTNPETNREFARKYNGVNYRQNNYHVKLAQALKSLS